MVRKPLKAKMSDRDWDLTPQPLALDRIQGMLIPSQITNTQGMLKERIPFGIIIPVF